MPGRNGLFRGRLVVLDAAAPTTACRARCLFLHFEDGVGGKTDELKN
jgi:hypothetical protein